MNLVLAPPQPKIYHIAHVLLATVHWVMSREGATQHDSVARQVYDWNARKQQFTPRQLAIAEERLKSQG